MATLIQSALSLGTQGFGRLSNFCERHHKSLAVAGLATSLALAAIGKIPSPNIDMLRKPLLAASSVTMTLAAYGKIVNLQKSALITPATVTLPVVAAPTPAPVPSSSPLLSSSKVFYDAYTPTKTIPLASGFLLPSQKTDKESILRIPDCEHLNLQTTNGKVNAIITPTNLGNNTTPRHCIFYNNPNGVTVGEWFSRSTAVPFQFAKLLQCPFIAMYDYRGAGISKTQSNFSATAESLVEDGTIVLSELSKKFDHIYVIGTSLGGAVATAALHNHLSVNPSTLNKFHLINHDSFSSTHKVFRLLFSQTISEHVAKKAHVFLDVRPQMKNLIKNKIPIMILSQRDDKVIPELARMITFVRDKAPGNSAILIESSDNTFTNMFADFPTNPMNHGTITINMNEQIVSKMLNCAYLQSPGL